MRAHWDEGGGRILLGDNRRRGCLAATDQIPCFGVWVSAGLCCVHVYSWPYVRSLQTCAGPSITYYVSQWMSVHFTCLACVPHALSPSFAWSEVIIFYSFWLRNIVPKNPRRTEAYSLFPYNIPYILESNPHHFFQFQRTTKSDAD
jgi:hypothetical protein